MQILVHVRPSQPRTRRCQYATASISRLLPIVFAGTVLAANFAAVGCSLIVPDDFVGNAHSGTAGTSGTSALTGMGGIGIAGKTSSGGSGGTGGNLDLGHAGSSELGGGGNGGGGAAGNAGRIDSASRGGVEIAGNAGSRASTSCNPSCTNSHVCKNGECICPSGQGDCNGVCITIPAGAGLCDVCGNVCRSDQICASGACACPTGLADCGTACVDLNSDPKNCRACNVSCQSGQTCFDGICKTTPCDGLCTNPETLAAQSEGFRLDPVVAGAHCIAIVGYLPTMTSPRILCWNFDSARSLSVNGQVTPCTTSGGGIPLAPQRLGWYCIQVGMGTSGGFLLPNQ